MKSVCVFCGCSDGRRKEFVEAAGRLGRTLAERGLAVVYGGATVGLMGQLADAALKAGGEVVGVIPERFIDRPRNIAHQGLTELHVVDTMHRRKELMAQLADAFIALPGGLGTLEEMLEALCWVQLRLHAKPCGLLDVGGYYQPLLRMLDVAVAEEFLKPEHRNLLAVAETPEALLDQFAHFQPPETPKLPCL